MGPAGKYLECRSLGTGCICTEVLEVMVRFMISLTQTSFLLTNQATQGFSCSAKLFNSTQLVQQASILSAKSPGSARMACRSGHWCSCMLTRVSLGHRFHPKLGQQSLSCVFQSLLRVCHCSWLLVAPQVWLIIAFGLPFWLLMQCHLTPQWVLYADTTQDKVN